METAASTQTRETVTKFFDKCKDFKLAKAEILNVINLRPTSDVELTPVCVLLRFTKSHCTIAFQPLMIFATFLQIIEKPDEREIDIDGILALVQELLPPLPSLEAPKENEQEETEDGEQEETDDAEKEETEDAEQS